MNTQAENLETRLERFRTRIMSDKLSGLVYIHDVLKTEIQTSDDGEKAGRWLLDVARSICNVDEKFYYDRAHGHEILLRGAKRVISNEKKKGRHLAEKALSAFGEFGIEEKWISTWLDLLISEPSIDMNERAFFFDTVTLQYTDVPERDVIFTLCPHPEVTSAVEMAFIKGKKIWDKSPLLSAVWLRGIRDTVEVQLDGSTRYATIKKIDKAPWLYLLVGRRPDIKDLERKRVP